MPRTKPKNKITTRQEAESAMARLCEIERMLASLALTEAEEIAHVRKRHAGYREAIDIPALEAEMSLHVRELQAWAHGAREEWPQKTLATPWGSLGYRTPPKAVALIKAIAKNEKEALHLLECYLAAYVRKVPTIDKEGILAADREGKLDAEALRECGLKIQQKEEFWLETTASEELKAAAERLKNA
jgi:hypothetical protein